MAHAENTVTVDRPAGEVFAFLADGRNNPRWRSGVLEIERSSPGDGEGATYRQVIAGPGGRRGPGDYRVTVHEAPHRLEFQVVAGPARPHGAFELTEPEPGRTTVHFTLDLAPKGLMRLMDGMVAKQMRAEVAQLTHLKTELEG